MAELDVIDSFDLNDTIPMSQQDGGIRAVPGSDIDDFDLNETVPVPTETLGSSLGKASLAPAKPIQDLFNKPLETTLGVANIIYWPWKRFVEHPISTLIEAAQEGDMGTPGLGLASFKPKTLAKAGQAFLPKAIPEEEYGTYTKVWDKYFQDSRKLLNQPEMETPKWYLAMASYGSAMGTSRLGAKAVEFAGAKLLTRPATTGEAETIRNLPPYKFLKTGLEQRGVDITKLKAEGSIISFSDDVEIFLSKNVTAILKGDKIRVPRWAKIPVEQPIAPITESTIPATVNKNFNVLPLTTKNIVPTPVNAPLESKVQPTGEGLVTKEQLAQAHIIAKEKLLVTSEGKPKPQYRKLAEGITGKKTMKDMTQEEAKSFIESLTKLSEPVMKGGKLVPPTIAKTKEIVPEGFFEQKFKKPTPAKLLTSQSRYAELLGVKKLVEPMEIGKAELDLEYGKLSNQTDIVVKKLKKLKTIPPEKMAQLLNTNETAPAELNLKEKEVFNYFDSLRKELLVRQNEALASQGLPPIKGVKAYFRHIADQMSEEVIEGKYAPPEGVKYWSEQMISKKVYNPMEMRRKIRDELLERFSKDLAYVTKSMVWTALKSIHLSIPKMVLSRELGVISKDKLVYKNLSPEERVRYDAVSTMPAATKKWLLDYVNIVLTGRQTSLDESVNRWVTESPIKDAVNKVLIPFGKHLGQNPVTKLISNISRLPIYGVMGGINPRQLMRNKMQTLQNLALYGVRNTLRGYLPTSKFPVLEELKTDSLFKKSYSGFEDMPAELRGKFEKIGLAPFQWSAISNVSQAMNSAYHWTANKIQNPKNKELGWADPQRTYEEPVDFFYPSEKEKLLKEMEYGAHTTQFQYIGLGMPEVFRYKALAGVTRLQSWWMNHWFIFHREAATRAFTGQCGYDTNLKVTLGDRLNYLKYLIIGGVILNTLGYERSFLLGTAPTGLPPTAALAYNLFVYYTNLGDDKYAKRKRGEAAAGIKSSAKTFIPGYLSIKDISALLSGEKDWTEYLFYKK